MSLLDVKNLKVYYPIKGGIFNRTTDYIKAVDGVSFTIEEGQTLGLVGESGSGKSTTGRAILGLEPITGGKIFYNDENIKHIGRNRSLYRKNVQMIFQDVYSSLNPRKRIKDIIAEPIRNFEKLTPHEEQKRVDELLTIVGMPLASSSKYPFEFSGGQRQRIGVARAIALKPKLIVADEPVSALDISVQAVVLNYLKEIQEELKIAYLFISHDMGVVKHMCETLAIMHNARFVEFGPRDDVYNNPKHIYTQRLISAIPNADPKARKINVQRRMEINNLFYKEYNRFYNQNGRVYDLKRVNGNHYAAMP